MDSLRVSLIQTSLHWQQPEANRAMLEEKIWTLQDKPDVIVLPEMFTTGFTMEAEKCAEPMNLHTLKWLRQMAGQTNAALTGSYIIKENDNYYNRLVFMMPSGEYRCYDKRHLFRMAGEHHTYTAGEIREVIEWRGWRIMPLICYDLRFPVWSRNVNLEYDLLIYVANWPAARAAAWQTLLRARAIENLCYCVGVNRVGDDGKDIHYAGDSAAIDPKGSYLWQASEIEALTTQTFSKADLLDYRAKFPANLDADNFEIH